MEFLPGKWVKKFLEVRRLNAKFYGTRFVRGVVVPSGDLDDLFLVFHDYKGRPKVFKRKGILCGEIELKRILSEIGRIRPRLSCYGFGIRIFVFRNRILVSLGRAGETFLRIEIYEDDLS